MLDWRSRACTAAMAGIYRRLLVRIQPATPPPCSGAASRCRPGEKAAVAVRALTRGRRGALRGRGGPRVVVVGGGLAGLAAALACADRGARVTLLERRNRLGGLTWSFRHADRWIDNGQHVFLRCCDQYLVLPRADRRPVRRGVAGPARPPGGWPRRPAQAARPGSAGCAGAGCPLRCTWPVRSCATRICPPPIAWRPARAMLALRRLDLADPALDEESFGSWLARHGQSPAASPPSGT